MKARDHFDKKEYAEAIQVWDQDFKNNPYLDSGYTGTGNSILEAAIHVFGKSKLESIDHLNLPIYYKNFLKAGTYYSQGNSMDAIQHYKEGFEILESETHDEPTTNINIYYLKAFAWEYIGHSYCAQYFRIPITPIINEMKQAFLKARQIGKLATQSYYGKLCYHTARSYLSIAKDLKSNNKTDEAYLLAEMAKNFAEEAIKSGEANFYYYQTLATYYANFTKNSREKVESLRQNSLNCTRGEDTKKVINHFFDQLIKSAIKEEKMLERYQKQIIDLKREVQQQAEQLVMLRQEIKSKDITEQQQAEQLVTLRQELQEIKSNAMTGQKLSDEMLFNAAKEGKFKKMDLAIQMGANIEVTDQEGLTPLFWSLLNLHYDLANFFLKNGASLEACNKHNETILHVMSRRGDIESVKFILSHFPKDDSEAKVLLSVHDLVSSSEDANSVNTAEIKQLIANAILNQAAKQGNINLAKVAMEKGANKDAQDEHLETALHKACYLDKVEMVQFLLEKGCSIAKKDKNNQTAIEVTSKSEIKELILNYQQKHATVMQANIRGFFGRQKYDEEKEKYWNDLQKRSADIFSNLAKKDDYDNIAKLARAINEARLHDTMEIIREISGKELQAVSNFKPK